MDKAILSVFLNILMFLNEAPEIAWFSIAGMNLFVLLLKRTADFLLQYF